eukprot:bmy_20476T0
MNPVAMATPAVGILTAPTAVSIQCGSAGSWEGVANLHPGRRVKDRAQHHSPGFFCCRSLHTVKSTQIG